MAAIPAWGPILAVLSEFSSSDDLLSTLLAAGFSGMDLSKEERYSHLTRKRAYLGLADKKFSASSTDDQWRVAVALSRMLTVDEERRERLRVVLETAGWRFDGTKFVNVHEPSHTQPAFFSAGEVHDAYVHIRSILQSARTELFIIDPWIGERIYGLVATVEGLKRCRILCGPEAPADFVQEAEVFAKQHAVLSLEIRASKEFHDRFVFADGGVYLFGASIEHAGARAFSVMPIPSKFAVSLDFRSFELISKKTRGLIEQIKTVLQLASRHSIPAIDRRV